MKRVKKETIARTVRKKVPAQAAAKTPSDRHLRIFARHGTIDP